MDETVETDVRPRRAAALTHHARVLVQKAVQPSWESGGENNETEGEDGAGVQRREIYGGR